MAYLLFINSDYFIKDTRSRESITKMYEAQLEFTDTLVILFTST